MQFYSFGPTIVAAFMVATFCCGVSSADAQLIPALKTRRFEPPYQYGPSDPWIRSTATNIQTKHYGLFYNCDSEECKRNSPFIKWQYHNAKDLPPKQNALVRAKCALDEVRQRIYDGAGDCLEAPCQSCQSGNCSNCDACQSCSQCQTCQQTAKYEQAQPACGCATCAAKTPEVSQSNDLALSYEELPPVNASQAINESRQSSAATFGNPRVARGLKNLDQSKSSLR